MRVFNFFYLVRINKLIFLFKDFFIRVFNFFNLDADVALKNIFYY